MERNVLEILDLLGLGYKLSVARSKRITPSRAEFFDIPERLRTYQRMNLEIEELMQWFDSGPGVDKEGRTVIPWDFGKVIGKTSNWELAGFLKISNQSLSNYKGKEATPYKPINSACVFLGWPINDLMEGNTYQFLRGVWDSQGRKVLNSNEFNHDSFEKIIGRVLKTLKWIQEECGENPLAVCSGERINSSMREILKNAHVPDSSLIRAIFPNSRVYFKDNPSLEFQWDRDEVIGNRFLDLFDLWMFTGRIRTLVEEYNKQRLKEQDPKKGVVKEFLIPNYYLSGMYFLYNNPEAEE